MNLKIVGPLLFAAMLFITSASIKIISFKNHNVWLDVSPELTLWAVGIFFSLSISEQTQFGGKTAYRISRKTSGTGIEINYDVILPDKLEFSPKYVYLFVFSIMIWILTILISGYATGLFISGNTWTPRICFFNFIGLAISGIVIGAAVRCLNEVWR
jgi:hypothetical protein